MNVEGKRGARDTWEKVDSLCYFLSPLFCFFYIFNSVIVNKDDDNGTHISFPSRVRNRSARRVTRGSSRRRRRRRRHTPIRHIWRRRHLKFMSDPVGFHWNDGGTAERKESEMKTPSPDPDPCVPHTHAEYTQAI